MIDPTDELSVRFDHLNRMAEQRGWPASSHAHPTRFGETLSIEKLEAPHGDEVRVSAVRAVIRLASVPERDRYAFARLTACLLTGRYDIAYFDAEGDMIDARSGDVAFHAMYLARRDARQAMGTGFDLLILAALGRALCDSGHDRPAERLAGVRSAMRGEGCDGIDPPQFTETFKIEL